MTKKKKGGKGLNKYVFPVYLQEVGDHSFERKPCLGGPLLKENIATTILERSRSNSIYSYSKTKNNSFYGQRRPMLKFGAKLLCVNDLLLLGRATIEKYLSI